MKRALGRAGRRLLGRRNLARVGRFLSDAGRLEILNDMAFNGEMRVQEVVLRHARGAAPTVVLDVGANVGEWTLSLLARWEALGGGDGLAVHAFEPSPTTFGMLRRAIEASPRSGDVRLVQQALSDAPGTAELIVSSDGAGSNSLHANFDTPAGARTEHITLTTLDSYRSAHGLEAIAMVKCDAEGHDLAVLRGARESLEERRIGVFQFEYNARWINSRCFLRDAFDFLEPRGYRVGKVTPDAIEFYDGWHPELETYREGNYLGCREDWVDRFPRISWWNDAV